jgi:L-ribulose-5-phosphate 3-epimerase
MTNFDRRKMVLGTLAGTAIVAAGGVAKAAPDEKAFTISLAQWSLHRQFFGRSGVEKLDPVDFAAIAKERCGIDAIEYVNQFYKDVVNKSGYVEELKKRAADAGVKNVLIMCDGEGNLGDPDDRRRVTAVRNHMKWLDWAKTLGCHSIRVNAASDGKLSYDEQQKLAADGLRRLCEIADTFDLNVIVENHGGLSSHGRWLRGVMEMVDHSRVGTLPDFGNFRIQGGDLPLEYDRYLGTYELMPFAKGVSAKSHDFNEEGEEVHTDYFRMIKIVLAAGFRGYIGVEFEGSGDSFEGIAKTKALLEKVRSELA